MKLALPIHYQLYIIIKNAKPHQIMAVKSCASQAPAPTFWSGKLSSVINETPRREIMLSLQLPDEYRLSVLDQQFHLRIYTETNLPSIVPMFKHSLVHNHRNKIIKTDRPASLMVMAQRHKPLIKALESGDTRSPADALWLHITTIVNIGPRVLPFGPLMDVVVSELHQ